MECFPTGTSNGFLCRLKTVAPWIFDSAYHDPSSQEFNHQRFIDVLEVGAEAVSKACTVVPYSVGLFVVDSTCTVAFAFVIYKLSSQEGLRTAHLWSDHRSQEESIVLRRGQDLCRCVAFPGFGYWWPRVVGSWFQRFI